MTKTTKIVILLIIAIVIIAISVLIAAFSVQKPKKEVIKIGVIAPLTGNAAELGQQIQRGLELALANTKNKYELIYEDDMCVNVDMALSAAHKFSIENVKYVIGPLCAPTYQAVSGIFNNNKISFMHTSGVTPPFIQSSGEYGIPGLSTTIHREDEFLADYIWNVLDIKKMGLLIWNEEWAIEHRKGFVNRFKELGGEIVFDEQFNLNQADFRTELTKLKNSGAEGVFIVALNFQTANIVKQMKELNIDIPIFSQFEIEDPAFLDAAGDAAEGVIYVYPKINTSNPETRLFIEKYKEKYGTSPNYYAFIGYDSLKLYDFAINKCGDDTLCVTKTILGVKDFPGVSGKISFNQNKEILREFVIKEIRNGKPVIVFE